MERVERVARLAEELRRELEELAKEFNVHVARGVLKFTRVNNYIYAWVRLQISPEELLKLIDVAKRTSALYEPFPVVLYLPLDGAPPPLETIHKLAKMAHVVEKQLKL